MTSTRLLARASLWAIAVATAAMASACSADPATTRAGAPATVASASPGASPGGTPAVSAIPTGSYEQRALAWGRRFAQCAREHGQPDFPDPRFVNADLDFAGLDFPGTSKDDIARAVESCKEVLQQMPPRPPANRPPSAETLRQMRSFAQCLRDRGVSAFPDPKADGTFPILGTPLSVFGPGGTLTPEQQRAWDACFDLQTNWRMQAS